MINIKRFLFIALATAGMWHTTQYAMNLLQPYNTILRPYYGSEKPFQITVFGEAGVSSKGFDGDGKKLGIAKLWECDQNALKMLSGFDITSPIGQKRAALQLVADDGVRGHFNVCADLDVDVAAGFCARYFFNESCSISAYLPVYLMRLKHVLWQEKTLNLNNQDQDIKRLLTNEFFANVKELGQGLDLLGWRRAGVGDLTWMFEWYRDFKQNKPFLDTVRFYWRCGLGLPTGKRQDPDKILAFPFGYDGSFSVPFGVGLDLYFGRYVRGGIDVLLTHIFGNTRCRRIKTHQDQSELLLLAKIDTHKDFGLRQQFSMHLEFYRILSGASFLFGYQFTKQGDDTVSFTSNEFSSDIANTARHLEEWTAHQVFTRFNYDIGVHLDEDARVRPQVGVYARMPFNGKRSALNTMVGAFISFDF